MLRKISQTTLVLALVLNLITPTAYAAFRSIELLDAETTYELEEINYSGIEYIDLLEIEEDPQEETYYETTYEPEQIFTPEAPVEIYEPEYLETTPEYIVENEDESTLEPEEPILIEEAPTENYDPIYTEPELEILPEYEPIYTPEQVEITEEVPSENGEQEIVEITPLSVWTTAQQNYYETLQGQYFVANARAFDLYFYIGWNYVIDPDGANANHPNITQILALHQSFTDQFAELNQVLLGDRSQAFNGAHNQGIFAQIRDMIERFDVFYAAFNAALTNEQPPATTPPATQPPATEPPATQPPATEPPATQPPATEPPATQPPATEPPTTTPPATSPSETPEFATWLEAEQANIAAIETVQTALLDLYDYLLNNHLFNHNAFHDYHALNDEFITLLSNSTLISLDLLSGEIDYTEATTRLEANTAALYALLATINNFTVVPLATEPPATQSPETEESTTEPPAPAPSDAPTGSTLPQTGIETINTIFSGLGLVSLGTSAAIFKSKRKSQS